MLTNTADDEDSTVFVGGINWQASEAEIKQYFQDEIGDVLHCKIIINRETGYSKGFGFLTFASASFASAAKSIGKFDFMSKTMNVDKAYRRMRPNSRRSTTPVTSSRVTLTSHNRHAKKSGHSSRSYLSSLAQDQLRHTTTTTTSTSTPTTTTSTASTSTASTSTASTSTATTPSTTTPITTSPSTTTSTTTIDNEVSRTKMKKTVTSHNAISPQFDGVAKHLLSNTGGDAVLSTPAIREEKVNLTDTTTINTDASLISSTNNAKSDEGRSRIRAGKPPMKKVRASNISQGNLPPKLHQQTESICTGQTTVARGATDAILVPLESLSTTTVLPSSKSYNTTSHVTGEEGNSSLAKKEAIVLNTSPLVSPSDAPKSKTELSAATANIVEPTVATTTAKTSSPNRVVSAPSFLNESEATSHQVDTQMYGYMPGDSSASMMYSDDAYFTDAEINGISPDVQQYYAAAYQSYYVQPQYNPYSALQQQHSSPYSCGDHQQTEISYPVWVEQQQHLQMQQQQQQQQQHMLYQMQLMQQQQQQQQHYYHLQMQQRHIQSQNSKSSINGEMGRSITRTYQVDGGEDTSSTNSISPVSSLRVDNNHLLAHSSSSSSATSGIVDALTSQMNAHHV